MTPTTRFLASMGSIPLLIAACSASESVVSAPPADAGPSSPSEAGPLDAAPPPTDAPTVDATPPADAGPPPVYTNPNDSSQWTAHDTQGFSVTSALFDGRYVYFPRAAAQASAEAVLRYDTQQPFDADASWTSFDTSVVPSQYWSLGAATLAGTRVYWGGTGFDASYDTTRAFDSPMSWAKTSIDMPYQNDGTSAVSDGVNAYVGADGESGVSEERWIFRYGPSGAEAVQIDALAPFGFSGSVFDGRYVWFTTQSANLLRFDTTAPKFEVTAIETVSAAVAGADVSNIAATAFDGRFLYFLGPGNHQPYLLRYDTTASASAASSWQRVDLTSVIGAFFDNYRLAFDGQNVYVMFLTSQGGPISVRYDTTKPFDPSSWTKIDSAPFNGDAGVQFVFNAAAFDGQNMYFTSGGKIWRFHARDRGVVPAFMHGGTFN